MNTRILSKIHFLHPSDNIFSGLPLKLALFEVELNPLVLRNEISKFKLKYFLYTLIFLLILFFFKIRNFNLFLSPISRVISSTAAHFSPANQFRFRFHNWVTWKSLPVFQWLRFNAFLSRFRYTGFHFPAYRYKPGKFNEYFRSTRKFRNWVKLSLEPSAFATNLRKLRLGRQPSPSLQSNGVTESFSYQWRLSTKFDFLGVSRSFRSAVRLNWSRLPGCRWS